jgi:hypothetical protein
MTESVPRVGAPLSAAIGATLWALLVVSVSFLVWGTVVLTMENPLGELMSGYAVALPEDVPGMSGSMTMTVELSGWSGTVSLVEGLDLPNATIPLAALVLAALAWLRVLGVWAAPRVLELALGILASAMLVVFLLAMLDADNASLGSGAWIALVGIVAVSFAVRGASSPDAVGGA